MPVFISYSHADKNFVDLLAKYLVRHRIHVWIDRWELKVGDSLITRIQDAVDSASAILVVLSKNSVESEWCKKELTSGLLRELEEKRVVVLPLIVDDCKIPLFLRDKLYADFRTNPDEGLQQTLESLAAVTSSRQGRAESPNFHEDWSVDLFTTDTGLVGMAIKTISHSPDHPYSVLTIIDMYCNKTASAGLFPMIQSGSRWYAERILIDLLQNRIKEIESGQYTLILEDANPKTDELEIGDIDDGAYVYITVTSQWLGEDTGKDIVLNYGGQIDNVHKSVTSTSRPPNSSEQAMTPVWYEDLMSSQSE